MSEHDEYNLIVIGSDPAGEKVAVIEKQPVLGGAGVNTGSIPSKTLKETALYFSSWRDRGLYSVGRELERAPGA